MTYSGLLCLSSTGCMQYLICLIWSDFCMACCLRYDLHTKVITNNRSATCLATASLCGFWGRGFSWWSTLFLVATKQPYGRFCPSVCLSVCDTFLQCSFHLIIMQFSGVIATKTNDVHAKGQDQMSKVKVTEVKIQFISFHTVTSVWVHTWR